MITNYSFLFNVALSHGNGLNISPQILVSDSWSPIGVAALKLVYTLEVVTMKTYMTCETFGGYTGSPFSSPVL